MSVDHIVWDWNGTLLDDGDALVTATSEAFRAVGLPAVTRSRYRERFARPITDFYDLLAGRTLSPAEQSAVAAHFLRRYEDLAARASLADGALAALRAWHRAGRSQSLLSMYPTKALRKLVRRHDIAPCFTRVDGLPDHESTGKTPYLNCHLTELTATGIHRDRVLIVGDSVDDVTAARACHVDCVLYHPGDRALISLERARALAVPLATSLPDLVATLLESSTDA